MDFDAVAAEKAERQATLIEALMATPADASTSARDRLEQLLSPETLALDETVLEIITGETQPGAGPAPDVLTAARQAGDAQRQALLAAALDRRVRTAHAGPQRRP